MTPVIYLIFLFIPVYAYQSGGTQIVDIFLVLAFVLGLVRFRGYMVRGNEANILFFFFTYACLASLIDSVVFQVSENDYLTLITFAYSLMIFIFFHNYFHHLLRKYGIDVLCSIMTKASVISLVVPTLLFLSKPTEHGGRLILLFNNANQMAFFALLIESIFFYCCLLGRDYKFKPNYWLITLALGVNTLMLIDAASRAATVSYFIGMLGFYFLYAKQINQFLGVHRSYVRYLIYLFLLSLLGLFVYQAFNVLAKTRESGMFSEAGGLHNDVSMRIFDGLSYNFSNLWIMIFGTGEGSNPLRNFIGVRQLEFHNNFMGIFNQVGLIGLILYIYFLCVLVKSLWRRGLLYSFPFVSYMFYSMFQYGFRFRLSTIFIAFMVLISSLPITRGKE